MSVKISNKTHPFLQPNPSILKLNISPTQEDISGRDVDVFDLESIKTIDGDLLRKTFTTSSKYLNIDHNYFRVNYKYTTQLFNNIKKAITYKFNNITEGLNYTPMVQSLQEHYSCVLSHSIFGVPNMTEPFNGMSMLSSAIEEEIDNMIHRFLSIETYTNDQPLNELKELLKEEHFILKFQCLIKTPPSLEIHNIKDSIWNIFVLVD